MDGLIPFLCQNGVELSDDISAVPPVNGFGAPNGSAAVSSLLSLDGTMVRVVSSFSSQFWKRAY